MPFCPQTVPFCPQTAPFCPKTVPFLPENRSVLLINQTVLRSSRIFLTLPFRLALDRIDTGVDTDVDTKFEPVFEACSDTVLSSQTYAFIPNRAFRAYRDKA